MKLICILISVLLIGMRLADGCPNDCSGNGICDITGICACNNNYYGQDCSYFVRDLVLDHYLESHVASETYDYYKLVVQADKPYYFEIRGSSNFQIFITVSNTNIDRDPPIPTPINCNYATHTLDGIIFYYFSASNMIRYYVIAITTDSSNASYSIEASYDYSKKSIRCHYHGDWIDNRCICLPSWTGWNCTIPISKFYFNFKYTVDAIKYRSYYYHIIPDDSFINYKYFNLALQQTSGASVFLFKASSLPSPKSYDFIYYQLDHSLADVEIDAYGNPDTTYFLMLRIYDTPTVLSWNLTYKSTQGCFNNCSGPTHGTCTTEFNCVCNDGYTGYYCQILKNPLSLSTWFKGDILPGHSNYYTLPLLDTSATIIFLSSQNDSCVITLNNVFPPTIFDNVLDSYEDLYISYGPTNQLYYIGITALNSGVPCVYNLTVKPDVKKPNSTCPQYCVAPRGYCLENSDICSCIYPYAGPHCENQIRQLDSPYASFTQKLKHGQWAYYRLQYTGIGFLIAINQHLDSKAPFISLYISIGRPPDEFHYDWYFPSSHSHLISQIFDSPIPLLDLYLAIYCADYPTNDATFTASIWIPS